VATGAWAERLRPASSRRQLRPLRGSHLLLPGWRLPVAQAFSFMHAEDGRPVFVFPWEGATVVGTTDLDHRDDLDQSASISQEELRYLLAACAQPFPQAMITASDVLSTWAGVRPVVAGSEGQQGKPSNETREHVLWQEPGCVTLAGGKLTTFRPQAIEVLQACGAMLGREVVDDGAPVFAPVAALDIPGLSGTQARRLAGRYGRDCRGWRNGWRRWAAIASVPATPCGPSWRLPPRRKWSCTWMTCCCAGPASACCWPRAPPITCRPSAACASRCWVGTMAAGRPRNSATGPCGNAITACPPMPNDAQPREPHG